MHVTYGTDVGLVRVNNEDNYICLPPYAFAVADGMGGHAAGEVASKLLIEEARRSLQEEKGTVCGRALLEEIIVKANSIILEKAAGDKKFSGMGTTASMVYVQKNKVEWAHIGDSRIYFLHGGQLAQVTTDHSLVDMLVKNGTITAKEALHHPQKNILTRAVGVAEDIKVDTGELVAAAGDTLLLATDGLTNMVTNEVIDSVLANKAIDNKANCLIKLALKNGGIDNITAIVVEF